MTDGKAISIELRRELENAWEIKVPDLFWNFLTREPSQSLPDIDIFTVEEMIMESERTVRLPPNLRLFGKYSSGDSYICFHTVNGQNANKYEVVCWNIEERCLIPCASNFVNFLCKHLYSTRYNLDEEGEHDIDVKYWSGLFNSLEVEAAWVFDEIPMNEKMMYETMSQHDRGDCLSQCHLGCILRSRGQVDEATHHFNEASKYTPWFGDAYYLLADVFRVEDSIEKAFHEWWKILNLPVVYSTRSDSWDLGADYPDADIYELTVDLMLGVQKSIPSTITDTPLWNAFLLEDPYDPVMREKLAETYSELGMHSAAESELWNAYFLYADDEYDELVRINSKLITLLDIQRRTYDVKQLKREQNRLLKHHEQ